MRSENIENSIASTLNFSNIGFISHIGLYGPEPSQAKSFEVAMYSMPVIDRTKLNTIIISNMMSASSDILILIIN